jgi:hypothetical protein
MRDYYEVESSSTNPERLKLYFATGLRQAVICLKPVAKISNRLQRKSQTGCNATFDISRLGCSEGVSSHRGCIRAFFFFSYLSLHSWATDHSKSSAITSDCYRRGILPLSFGSMEKIAGRLQMVHFFA